MRKKLLSIIGLAIIFFLKASFAGAQGYNIKVRIAPLKDSLIYLANYFGDKQYIHDSAKCDANSWVTFKGKEKLAGGIYLVVMPGKKYFELIIDKEQNFTAETDTIDPVKGMAVKNSNDNKIFYEYLNFVVGKQKEAEQLQKGMANAKNKSDSTAIQTKLIETGSSVTSFKEKFIADNPDMLLSKVFNTSREPEVPPAPTLPTGGIDSTFAFKYYKSHYLDNVDFSDARLLRTPLFHTKIDTYIKKLTLQHPDSIIETADYLVGKAKANKEVFKYVVWYITNQYETSNIMGMDAVFVHMGKKYYTKDQATWVDSLQLYKIQERVKILDPILVGKKVQNITLEDTSGVYKSIYNVKAKYTVLMFWDPDCGHCQKTVPKMQMLYEKVKQNGVEVYGINTETEMDKWKKFIREKKLTFINVADPKLHNNFRYEFDIASTPQIFLLDDTKTIVAKKIDVKTLEDILEKKLNITIDVVPPEEEKTSEKH
jgi:peroxiredoxin